MQKSLPSGLNLHPAVKTASSLEPKISSTSQPRLHLATRRATIPRDCIRTRVLSQCSRPHPNKWSWGEAACTACCSSAVKDHSHTHTSYKIRHSHLRCATKASPTTQIQTEGAIRRDYLSPILIFLERYVVRRELDEPDVGWSGGGCLLCAFFASLNPTFCHVPLEGRSPAPALPLPGGEWTYLHMKNRE